MPSYCVFMQGLNEEVDPRAAELEESNALALAIVQPGNGYRDNTGFSILYLVICSMAIFMSF